MNKHKAHGKLMIVLIIVFAVVCVTAAIFLYHLSRNDKGKLFIAYNELLLSTNEEYIGYIDSEHQKVSIVNYSGKEISHLKIKDSYPAQIALGESSYFLLYRWESEDGDGKIVQYDYQSHKIKEMLVHNTATITCRNGYLFLGGWKQDEEDLFFHFIPCYNGFYADRYLEEEKFGKQINDLVRNQDGLCTVAGIKLYYHSAGYFSTEPVLDDYPGTSQGDFTKEDKKFNYQARTRREGKNRSMLLEKMNRVEDRQNSFYQLCEYQIDKNIYGVCNVLETNIISRPRNIDDVKMSSCYRIDTDTDKITIISSKQSCNAIMASPSVFVYQKDNSIIRQNVNSGEETEIYRFRHTAAQNIYVTGDWLLIKENGRCTPLKWNI